MLNNVFVLDDVSIEFPWSEKEGRGGVKAIVGEVLLSVCSIGYTIIQSR